MNIQLLHGDCLELMKEIPDGSVDMVLCDLPYGTTQCKWDSVIPFELLWAQYRRVLKKCAVVALFGAQPFTSTMIMSNIGWFKESLIWLKNRAPSGLHADTMHMKIHEDIVIFSEGRHTFNPQKWLVSDKDFLTQRKTFTENEYIGNVIYGGNRRTRKPDTGQRNPISILSCRLPTTLANTKTYSNAVEKRFHPTQKPVPLLEYLIKTYTAEGETVLDHCMGSGSTGVAAVNTGRSFIGIELDEKYYDIATKRIAEAAK